MFMLAASAAAVVMTTCPYPIDRWTALASKRELPPAAVATFGGVAEKDAPFQATDVIVSSPGRLPSTRFASAQARGCDLMLRYEYGGIAHGWATAELRFERDGWVVIKRR